MNGVIKTLTNEELSIELDLLHSQIKELFTKIQPEDGAYISEMIVVDVIVQGSNNLYEGLGVLEEAKQTYRNICEEAMQNDAIDNNITNYAKKDNIIN